MIEFLMLNSNERGVVEMRRIIAALFVLSAMLAYVMLPPAASAEELAIGTVVESFSLPDVDGKAQTLDGLKGKNGTVVVWLSAQCPVVRGYKDRINEIAEAYKAKGINFVGINSNSTEDLNWVKSNIAEFGYKFPVLIDKGNVLADKWGATVTPEVFYFDAKNKLLYHGAIDNDRAGDNVTSPYLKAAFDASLTGKAIEKTRANAFGCSIKRAGK